MPLEQARASIHRVFAFVISAEFVKVVLAILAIYVIVRYVITKPVMHLKKVSDAIAQGNLDMRAEIRTGDEFEELSHAFNRMLRHLVTIQDELKDVNNDLDNKIDQLAQVNLRLYELNNLKNEFLATMSHELRISAQQHPGFQRRVGRRRQPRRSPASLRLEHPVLRTEPADDDQRRSRPGQDRERADGGPRRGILAW
ncbi:MAG: hypothetical protein Ct9H300mP1_04620 [Planctomycetaceae bacterium]|nr:MAG: hypothetical protein Ct9H300mP1_04620 [Planctomycetaceae bacterium]